MPAGFPFYRYQSKPIMRRDAEEPRRMTHRQPADLIIKVPDHDSPSTVV